MTSKELEVMLDLLPGYRVLPLRLVHLDALCRYLEHVGKYPHTLINPVLGCFALDAFRMEKVCDTRPHFMVEVHRVPPVALHGDGQCARGQ